MRQFGRFGPLVAAVEQPTHAARFTVFAANTSEMLTYHQIPVNTLYPKDGWVEQNPMEILNCVLECIEITLDNLHKLDINPEDIVSIGVTNQRETVIAWDVTSGVPLNNAMVWMDTRASSVVERLSKIEPKTKEAIESCCGLPMSAYFTAPKLNWLLHNNESIKVAIANGTCKVGTVDSWLIWNLTGGSRGGIHVTDITNASRTMLMNLVSQEWDQHLCDFFEIPISILPKIKSCSEIYGYVFTGFLTGIPISGCLGDQQAALIGQMCLEFGQAKCTFGAGAFLLCNTGTSLIRSKNGLLTTVAYKFGPNAPTNFALEGSGIIAGIALDWLKNGLGMTDNLQGYSNGNGIERFDARAETIKTGLLKKLTSDMQVQDPDEEGSVYFVPAFSGLYAPYWHNDARGVICGMSPNTRFSNVISSTSKALGFQTRAILESLNKDCGRNIDCLLVDGLLASNSPLMQIQADMCGIPMVRPVMSESSALGAAMAAGSASGVDVWPRASLPPPSDTFNPTTNEDERDVMYNRWKAAVDRSLGWATEKIPLYDKNVNESDIKERKLYASIPSGLFLISSYLLLLLADKWKT
ncbi:glycerol kinase 3-like [Arctopsyche grandis]|uniref:glycerol kinase 3-like n=1 Tax=Arctopsyche grandis TaxID=121162 RepID=UPI00406D89BB